MRPEWSLTPLDFTPRTEVNKKEHEVRPGIPLLPEAAVDRLIEFPNVALVVFGGSRVILADQSNTLADGFGTTSMDQDEILLDAEERMEKAVQHFTSSLTGIRTGRANPGLVDSVKVDYYGSPTPLKQIANVSVPEPQQILIRPFDVSSLDEIAKAIQNSDLGMAPNNDGRVVRLNVPPLSTERRKQLVGRVKELAEEARVSIRNVRRDANKHADQGEKDKSMTEDDRDRVKDQVQELTKKYEGTVNSSAEAKEKEVMDE